MFTPEELAMIRGMAEYSFPANARPALVQSIIDKLKEEK